MKSWRKEGKEIGVGKKKKQKSNGWKFTKFGDRPIQDDLVKPKQGKLK